MQTEKKVAAAGKLRRFFIFCTLGGTLHKKRKRKKEEKRGEGRRGEQQVEWLQLLQGKEPVGERSLRRECDG